MNYIASLFNAILYPGLCLRLPLCKNIEELVRLVSNAGKELDVYYLQGFNITISNQAPYVHRRKAPSPDSILFLVALKEADTLWPLQNSKFPYLARDTKRILGKEQELAAQLRAQTPHNSIDDFNNNLSLRAALRKTRKQAA